MVYNRPMMTDEHAVAFNAIEDFAARVAAACEERDAKHPYYTISKGIIVMPPLAVFDGPCRYYAALLHEHAHWTGAQCRLNR